jgi:hypothetical protein
VTKCAGIGACQKHCNFSVNEEERRRACILLIICWHEALGSHATGSTHAIPEVNLYCNFSVQGEDGFIGRKVEELRLLHYSFDGDEFAAMEETDLTPESTVILASKERRTPE